MKKWFMMIMVICMVSFTGCEAKSKTTMDLDQITLKQLNKQLENKGAMVVYFGWIEHCTDSKNFQKNYLNKQLEKNVEFENIKVVNLDKEMPKALEDHDLREPLKQRYNVEYSPTLVYYVDGKALTKLEWTPDTTDKKTGIMKSQLDAFFKECGYLQ